MFASVVLTVVLRAGGKSRDTTILRTTLFFFISRTGFKRQGTGECSRRTRTRETVLVPDGSKRSGEALAETVRRQGAGRRVGGWRDKNFWVVTTKLISRKKATTKGTTHKYMRLLASYLAPLRAAHKNFFRTTSTSSTSTMATESHPETHPHQVHHDYT